MQITIECNLAAPDVSRVVLKLRELLHEERDHPESMRDGYGYALVTAIGILENVRTNLAYSGRDLMPPNMPAT
jgi:hypothetical protein